jgi:hypothetical protein
MTSHRSRIENDNPFEKAVRLLSRADVPCGKRLDFTLSFSFIAAYFAEGMEIS